MCKMASTSAFLVTLAALLVSVQGAEKLTVHIVPHTHDDVGWLKTVDQYYYGAQNTVQHAAVQYIIDSVVDELMKNSERKFIYVEIAFFERWWDEQSKEMKDNVRGLVKDRRLEFINGGWCMNDEAATHYNAIIDQMTLGFQFIERNFGPEARPTIGWHIDPFGHSAEQAALFSMMGFDGFFFGRIDYDDKLHRLNTSTMEMVWRGSDSLQADAEIFTGVTYNNYAPPGGFCYDVKCSNQPIMDDPNLEDYNVDEIVDQFIRTSLDQAKHFNTDNIMMTFGGDFNYEAGVDWFKNIDKLIQYVNKNGTINVKYSTPSLYVEAINEANREWTVKTDDFFPYADNKWAFWTGYFTSRPAFKGYVRKCNNHLQVCKQLEAMNKGPSKGGPSSVKLQKAMGVSQHHDAVSGTEKQLVADDYAKRLHIGEVECREVISDALNNMMVKGGGDKMNMTFCEYLNISACPVSETGNFNLVIYNPLGSSINTFVRFPVNTDKLSVTDPNGKDVTAQVIPVSDATKTVRGPKGKAKYEAVINVDDLPPLGYAVYNVKTASRGGSKLSRVIPTRRVRGDTSISNDLYKVLVDGQTGRLSSITNMITGIDLKVDQQFMWYNSSAGNNKNSTQASGAYIFRPNGTDPFPVNDNKNIANITNVVQGDHVQEIHQQFAPWVTQVIRLYHNIPLLELEYTVGPIPVRDGLGKEIISRFDTELATDGVWYTDANGRGMQMRKRNYRPTWKYNNTEPVAGNYYPVNSRIYIKEDSKDTQFTVLNDRSQGGSSMKDGSVELMVHRRCLYDDRRGVGEPLNETGQYFDGLIIRGKHYIILDNLTMSAFYHRVAGERIMLGPQLTFVPTKTSYHNMNTTYNLKRSGLTDKLPLNVHLLTLQYLEQDKDQHKLLLRLEHQFDASEPMNNSVTVHLKELFSGFDIKDSKELILGANADLDSVHKMQWKTKAGSPRSHHTHIPDPADKFDITLLPMQIRTFNITVEYKD